MDGIPYIREGVIINDIRKVKPESAEEFLKKIPNGILESKCYLHEFIYGTDLPKRILLVNAVDTNPYHILFYMIARFYYVDNGESTIEYVYKTNSYICKQALDNLPSRFIRKLEKEEGYEYVQCPGCHWIRGGINESWPYEYLRNLYKHIWESTPREKGKGIYISRNINSVYMRAILNENELKPVLKDLGISYYALENMTFIDTIRLFKSAEFVTGSHGAGLAWIIFCDPGTKVLEIYKNKPLKEYYKDICNKMNLQFSRFIDVQDDPAGSNFDVPDDGNMIINIDTYSMRVKELLEEKQ